VYSSFAPPKVEQKNQLGETEHEIGICVMPIHQKKSTTMLINDASV